MKFETRRDARRVMSLLAIGAVALGTTMAMSAESRRLAPGSRPNVLVIVADDMGYTDLGAFGGEIHTPNLDRLAAAGTILTNYYSSVACAPTRSMLLSGTDNHRAGEGRMGMAVEDAPGYEDYLNHRVVSLPSRLQAAGYHTYMAGKWHLGQKDDQSPSVRGFEHSFVLLQAASEHFALPPGTTGMGGIYRDDGKVVPIPQDFYSTTYYTDKMLGYLKQNAGDGKPFFAYLAYTAPHSPLQAPDADIARQRGRYDEGYEVLRQNRFKGWLAKGFGSKNATLPNLPPGYSPWSALTADEQAKSSRTMEVYAAMVERLDTEAGRVLKYLEDSGQMRNTIVIFQSDNGAAGGGGGPGGRDNSLENIGRVTSFAGYGTGWASASEAPYYLLKFYTAEGGIHAPAFVSGAALGIPKGRHEDSLIMTYDLAPTILELAGASTAPPKDQPDALPITGRSFASVLRGQANATRRGANDVVGWEHSGQAAIRKGDWKLLWVGAEGPGAGGEPGAGRGAGPGGRAGGRGAGAPGAARGAGPGAGLGAGPPGAGPGAGLGAGPGSDSEGPAAGPAGARGAGGARGLGAPRSRASLAAGQPAGDPVGTGGPWRLYNLREDPHELHDQSRQHPEILAQLVTDWQRYVADNGVIVKSGQPAPAAQESGIPD
jgi:arylsulfatase A-like enzyme